MPSFMSSKRAKAITVAAAGTMALATAISVGASIASSPAPIPATADAFMTTVSNQNSAQVMGPAGMNGTQTVLFDQMRSLQQQHAQQAAAAKAAAAKADAVRKAAAVKAAAAKAEAARKAAAQKAAEQAAAARKAAAAQQAKKAQAAAVTTPTGSPKQIAQQMLSKYGWSQSQFSCLEPLWFHESGWNPAAENPSSGAYGIPQALPGSQMASAGPDWRTNPATQIRWGLNYIQSRYGSPCGAWAHEQADNWY
jgi:beta-glucosidase-like glycosyl hydrolase